MNIHRMMGFLYKVHYIKLVLRLALEISIKWQKWLIHNQRERKCEKQKEKKHSISTFIYVKWQQYYPSIYRSCNLCWFFYLISAIKSKIIFWCNHFRSSDIQSTKILKSQSKQYESLNVVSTCLQWMPDNSIFISIHHWVRANYLNWYRSIEYQRFSLREWECDDYPSYVWNENQNRMFVYGDAYLSQESTLIRNKIYKEKRLPTKCGTE